MNTILTITPNPCIDINSSVPEVLPEKKLRCSALKKEPGGGGINVSRVLKRFGTESMAIYFEGGYTGTYFTSMLLEEQINCYPVEIAGHTRENFIIAATIANQQFRFGMPGPAVKDEEWLRSLSIINEFMKEGYHVASGSLSEGMPIDYFARVAHLAKQKKARLMLDSSGDALLAALKEGVYLVKPNLNELSLIAGRPVTELSDILETGRKCIDEGACTVMVVSMASSGALLITKNDQYLVKTPSAIIKSTVGAGDSMVAGLIQAIISGKNLHESLQYAVASGTATTMQLGTALCDPHDVEKLYNTIKKT